MSRSRTTAFWLAVAFQVLVVAAMVGAKQWLILSGKTIVLVSEPYDPYALFRGQYAQLRYAINTVQTRDFSPWPVKPGQEVYAELAPGTTSWTLVDVQSQFPSRIPAGHVILKGEIESGSQWEGRPVAQLKDISQPGWLAGQPSTATWRQSWRGIGQQKGIYYNGRLPEGSTVYVMLTNYGNNQIWNQSGVYDSMDQAKRAVGSYYRTMILQGIIGPLDGYKTLSIQYGLETYYLSEDVARSAVRHRFRVEAAVDERGRSTIKSAALMPEPAALTPTPLAVSVVPSSGPYHSSNPLRVR